ncbi:peptidoglycan DD-metalloendopeptidase family protein [Kocuria varians]|uniref:Murein DD-endopeptidase MepM n=1 Tax=Kocuria varians TaxID=1272 RepID=A0A7D7Q7X1_KOCVA|nr:peptidoglycan DD-metalloendopeptidase family protein [Kocuria varians]QMS56183.1 Murein DD-endopeptidase MepM [Kocuria varians]
MALTAFTSFSLLVAVSVAVSNGTVTAPWQSAMAHDAQGPQQVGTSGEPGGAGDDAAAQPVRASLFASVADQAAIDESKVVPASFSVAGSAAPNAEGGAASSPASSTGSTGGGNGVSSLAPSTHAPATFEGKLPVNTLIAPAQPVIVLKGGEFGWRTAPDTGQYELHNGTDISAPEGTPVVAALDGTVTAVFWDVWGGNRVEVSHANGMKTTYNHLSKVMVRVGDSLKASEQLGEVGQTGLRVTGPHLHFETWVDGKVVDAQSFDWETGKGIIKASRAPYSTQDENSVQPKTDPNAKPGTDLGPLPDTAGLPAADKERVTALRNKKPADQKTGGAGKGQGQSGKNTTSTSGGQQGKQTTEKGKINASGGQTGTQSTGKGKTTAPGGGSGATTPSTGTGGKGSTGGGKNTHTETPKPSTTEKTKPTVPSEDKHTPPPSESSGAPQPPKPGTSESPAPGSTKSPVPKETGGLDVTAVDVNQLTTLLQLQQRTQLTVGAYVGLSEEGQKNAYVTDSPLDRELKALLARSATLKVPATNPYVKALTTASDAVTAASPAPGKPMDPALTKVATDALAALRAEALKVGVYVRPVAADPAAPGAGAPAVPGK